MSAGGSTCALCGWRSVIRRRRPDPCARCSQIEEMFHGWMSVIEIAKRLDMTHENVRHVVRQLGLKRPPRTCPACGWQGRLQSHNPRACALNIKVRSLWKAGTPGGAIARKLGVSRALLSFTMHRLEIKSSPPRVEVSPVCGWRGAMYYHTPEHCAWFLRLRQMHKAGLPRRVIVRELRISYPMFFASLRLLGLSATKPPTK